MNSLKFGPKSIHKIKGKKLMIFFEFGILRLLKKKLKISKYYEKFY